MQHSPAEIMKDSKEYRNSIAELVKHIKENDGAKGDTQVFLDPSGNGNKRNIKKPKEVEN